MIDWHKKQVITLPQFRPETHANMQVFNEAAQGELATGAALE